MNEPDRTSKTYRAKAFFEVCDKFLKENGIHAPNLQEIERSFDGYFDEEYMKYNYVDEQFLDTCVRDGIMDCVAEYMTGFWWPINGDSSKYKDRFQKAFKKSALEKGWKIK